MSVRYGLHTGECELLDDDVDFDGHEGPLRGRPGAAFQSRGREPALVILLEVPDDVIVERLGARGRDDDGSDIVRSRLSAYRDHTAPLIDYYEPLGLLQRVDGTRSPETVGTEIRAAL